MLNNIDSSLNNGLQEAQSTLSANKIKSNGTNSSESKLYLIDEGNISQEALQLYQRDQDITKYTKMLCSDQITEQEANQQVASLIESGAINISEDDLAESIMSDTNLLQNLYEVSSDE
jgi:hypothetical protein